MANQASPRERARRPATAAIVFQGELDYISRCILDYPEIETGGELFGYWTAAGEPVVLYAIGPGPRANHEVAFFNQDLEYLVAVGRRLGTRFGLQHIGEWHSHHCLGLAQPSGRTLLRIALMAVLTSSVDLHGRYVSSAVAGHRDVVSPRKLAAVRMAVITVLIVCVAFALIFAPETFPCTTVWKGVCLFGAMLVPLAVAFADLRKAKA